MFGVGMHFSLNDLLQVRRIALPGAILQIAVATLLGIGVSMIWGWSFGSALVFGLSLSCASTVVLLKALGDRGLLNSVNGKIAGGWLLVEDWSWSWCWYSYPLQQCYSVERSLQAVLMITFGLP